MQLTFGDYIGERKADITNAYIRKKEKVDDVKIVAQKDGGKGSDPESSQWKHFVGGAVAGAASRTLTAPLDRLKVIAQVTEKKINNPLEGFMMMYKEGGMVSMWRGNGINIVKIAPENAVKFLIYDELKKFYQKTNPDRKVSLIHRIVSGGFAGILAHSVIFPLEVVKTRMVMQTTETKSSVLKTLIDGIKVNGFQMLFKGIAPSLLGIFAFSAADLTSYETMKKMYVEKYSAVDHVVPIPAIILFGCLSSVFGITFSYPLGMVAAYLQFADHPGISNYQAAKNFLQKRWRDDGILGLYKGGVLAMMKTVPSIAITYVVYEKILRVLDTKMTS